MADRVHNTIGSADLILPNEIRDGIVDRIRERSVVASLSGSTPVDFNAADIVVVGDTPRAQMVGESAPKGSSKISFDREAIAKRKFQTTVRVSQEFLWADEEVQNRYLDKVGEKIAESLEDALDLIVLHGIDPSTGLVDSTAPKITDTALRVTATADAELTIEAAYELLANANEVPTGLALANDIAFQLATKRYSDGRKAFPDMPLNVRTIGSFLGLDAVISGLVHADKFTPAGAKTGVKGIIGDFREGLTWGVVREIPLEVIEYGDPDGGGDLKGHNEVAIRAEVVYGWHVFKDRFAVINAGGSSSGGGEG